MNPMSREMDDFINMSLAHGFSHATVAKRLGITEGYWFKIRKGILPMTDEVLKKVRKLKDRIKAFEAA